MRALFLELSIGIMVGSRSCRHEGVRVSGKVLEPEAEGILLLAIHRIAPQRLDPETKTEVYLLGAISISIGAQQQITTLPTININR
jgi:hypothetical protein